jgi:sigma-B regulation protein RsbU (phosphoserine phosphatase)
MANVQATLRGQTLASPTAAVCVQRANKLLHQSTSSDKFVTLFYSSLDTSNHTLTYCNAGHDNPFHFSGAGPPHRLSTGGLVLSIMEDFPYQEDVARLLPGDVVVVYSDGITEAVDPRQVQFGDQKIESVVSERRSLGAAGIIDAIISAVREHAGSAPQADDMTIVVIKRL